MGKWLVGVGAIALVSIGIWFGYARNVNESSTNDAVVEDVKAPLPETISQEAEPMPDPEKSPAPMAGDFVAPLDRAAERVNKKPFGIYITTANSPVQPERFHGYHTGADFEIFSDEANRSILVQAVCTGKLILKKTATGYGGVVVQSCEANGEPITVVYGHVQLASITAKVGDTLQAGDMLGYLGTGQSAETDGERTHLHLGFHRGTNVNILGYVQREADLSEWIDPCRYVCGK